MKRQQCRRNLLIVGLATLFTLWPMGCTAPPRGESGGLAGPKREQTAQRSTAASDSPTIRWLLRDPKYNQW